MEQDSQVAWSASSFLIGVSQYHLIVVPTALAMVAPWEAANPSGPRPDTLHHLTPSRAQCTLAHQPARPLQLPLINPLLLHPAFQFRHVPTSASSQTTLARDTARLHRLAVSPFPASPATTSNQITAMVTTSSSTATRTLLSAPLTNVLSAVRDAKMLVTINTIAA